MNRSIASASTAPSNLPSRGGTIAAAGLSRRTFLDRNALGLGGVALACLLGDERLLANPPTKPPDPHAFDLQPRQPHFPPQAKAMISLFMQGGPSHVDLLDPKPELTRLDGTDYEREVEFSGVQSGQPQAVGQPLGIREARPVRAPKFPSCSPTPPKSSTTSASSARCKAHDQQSRPAAFFRRRTLACRPAVAGLVDAVRPGLRKRRSCRPMSCCPIRPACRSTRRITGSNGFMPPMFQGTLLRSARAADRESRSAGPAEGRCPAAEPVAVGRAESPASRQPSRRGRSGRPDRQL